MNGGVSPTKMPANAHKLPALRFGSGHFQRPGLKRRSLKALAAVCLGMAVATATAIGCGWGPMADSVRFNGFPNEREFGRLPPLLNYDGLFSSGSEADYEEKYQNEQRRQREAMYLWTAALEAERRGDLTETHRFLLAYQNSYLPELPQSRNSLLDQLDAFSALAQGSPAAHVRAYLTTRRAYDGGGAGEEICDMLDAMPADANLADNVAYLRAALLYRAEQYDEAARAFQRLADRYPRSEKREAALFMTALSLLKQSSSYNAASASATATAPCADCRDEAWRRAAAAFARVMRQYPRGRLQTDARGWLAYMNYRVGDTAGALVEYYRQLAATNERARYEALVSLRMVRPRASETEMERVEAALADEPEAALIYAYHNIYNFAYTFDDIPEEDEGTTSNYSPSDYHYQSQRREALESERERREIARAAAFATRLLRRYPRASVSGAFALRLAQANLELDENGAAVESARRALRLGVAGESRAEALWVKGVAEHRLRDYTAARRSLSALINENPQGRLTAGARRLLAMVAEDMGDRAAALEQYLALDYQYDVAYFVDVLMTPSELEAFIVSHPESERRDELLYALGVRYLRAGRYADARAAYARVRTRQHESFSFSYGNSPCDYQGHNCRDIKELWEGDDERGVPARWVLRDIQTADDLERLERLAAEAEGDEGRAEALYQLASYLFEGSNLLFYNPAAWRGQRYWNLSHLHEANRYRMPNEAQALWSYMRQHEAKARALAIYLEVARRFPDTRAARDALYSAAVCHERLSDFNPYWRDIYSIGLHAGERMVTYEDVRRTYPDYQLPRATLGWEPATRTVNGGPGWVAAPPRVRLTRWQRNEIRVRRIAGLALQGWQWAAGIWEAKVKRWLMIWLAAMGAVCALLFAQRTRALWRKQLARFSPGEKTITDTAARAGTEEPFLSSTKPFGREVRDELRARGERIARAMLPLVFDREGRRALTFNLLAHVMVAAMLLALLRAWHS